MVTVSSTGQRFVTSSWPPIEWEVAIKVYFHQPKCGRTHRLAFITIKFSVTCDLSGLPSFFCQLGFHIGRERERRADGIDRILSTKLATNRRTKEFRHHDDVSCSSFEPTLHTSSTHVIFKLMAVRADVNQVYYYKRCTPYSNVVFNWLELFFF
jgi:hypothetical protein